MDVSISPLENALRDFIDYILTRKYGQHWVNYLRLSSERKARWLAAQQAEFGALSTTTLDGRLLYYSQFHELETIIVLHWQDGFHEAFPGGKRWIEVMLGEINKLRNPTAHSRELMEHQKHLVLGITGEIRTQIMRFRGVKDDMNSYFPVIEHVADSLGNKQANPAYGMGIVASTPVRVGDTVEIRVSSTDPQGQPLLYRIERLRSQARRRQRGRRRITRRSLSKTRILASRAISASKSRPVAITMRMARWMIPCGFGTSCCRRPCPNNRDLLEAGLQQPSSRAF